MPEEVMGRRREGELGMEQKCLEVELNSTKQVGPVLPGFPIDFTIGAHPLTGSNCREPFVNDAVRLACLPVNFLYDVTSATAWHSNSQSPQTNKKVCLVCELITEDIKPNRYIGDVI
jgi:hypothetical protein